MSLIQKARDAVKYGINGRPEGPEASNTTPEMDAFESNVQQNLTQGQPAIEKSLNAGVETPAAPQVISPDNALAMTTPKDFESVLGRIGQKKYEGEASKIREQNRIRAQTMETKNVATAFGNAMNKNELARSSHMRRMERKQARHAARMAAIGAVLKVGGAIAGGMIGGPVGAAAGSSAAGSVAPSGGSSAPARNATMEKERNF